MSTKRLLFQNERTDGIDTNPITTCTNSSSSSLSSTTTPPKNPAPQLAHNPPAVGHEPQHPKLSWSKLDASTTKEKSRVATVNDSKPSPHKIENNQLLKVRSSSVESLSSHSSSNSSSSSSSTSPICSNNAYNSNTSISHLSATPPREPKSPEEIPDQLSDLGKPVEPPPHDTFLLANNRSASEHTSKNQALTATAYLAQDDERTDQVTTFIDDNESSDSDDNSNAGRDR